MAQGYCVKCREKRMMKDAKEVTTKNGRLAAKGTCPECGAGMFKFLPKKEQTDRRGGNPRPWFR